MTKRRITTAILIALAFVLAAYRSHAGGEKIISKSILKPATSVPSFMRALRPNYPYSVVPGGVYSPAELRLALAKDAVVRSHYSGFNAQAVRLVTLREDRLQYVSYRLNNKIFWTKKRLRIPKGEVLLTDGQNCARTRCGNRLSATLQSPVNANEPTSALLTSPREKSQGKPGESLTVGPFRFTPSPSLGETAEDADTLSPAFPHSAVGAPLSGSPFEIDGINSASYASPSGVPGSFPGILNNRPILNVASAGPAPAVKPGQNLPLGADIPEPRRLSLVVLAFCVSFWRVARLHQNIRA